MPGFHHGGYEGHGEDVFIARRQGNGHGFERWLNPTPKISVFSVAHQGGDPGTRVQM